jgi:hypothetical protein
MKVVINKALEYLHEHYRPFDAKLGKLVVDQLFLGNQLYAYAVEQGKNLDKALQTNLLLRTLNSLGNIFLNKRELVALCIFDLELSIYFNEVLSYYGDKEIASLLVDSLLYQATTYEASSPSQSDIIYKGTQNARGIHKYSLSKKQFQNIGDIEAWVFGKEIASIYGRNKDISIILGVTPISFIVRSFAKDACAFSIYGVLPTEAEQNAFLDRLKELNRHLIELIDKIAQ